MILPSTLSTLPTNAQTNGIDQLFTLTAPPTGGKFLQWDGKLGRSYFMQISDPTAHLTKWNWAPVIERGNNQSISYEVDGTADKGFFRLQYTDQTATNLDTADFDADGLTNLQEITPFVIAGHSTQTNPLDSDTDHDGLTDRFERDHGLDPTDDGSIDPTNGPNGDPDGDGVSNIVEQTDGTNPANSDTDGDGLSDGWEITNRLDPLDNGSINPDNGPSGDPDGAGILNLVDSTPHQIDRLVAVVETELLTVYNEHGELLRNTTITQQRLSVDRLFLRHPKSLGVIVPIAHVLFDGDSGFGELATATVWIEASETATVDRKLNLFNLLDTNYPSILTAQPSLQVRESLEFTVHAFSIQSESIAIHPGVTDLTENTPTLHQAAYINPITLEWRSIDGFDNVDDHIDPWTIPETKNGKRIFPDAKDPDHPDLQDKLEVTVKTSPALVDKTVYVKSFDVDDSTSEAFDMDADTSVPVIDTNGKAGDDNLNDYKSTPKSGHFWTGSAWGGNTATGVVDANGETKFTFGVGMQPGNNYRVVASVIDDSMYADVQLADPTAPKYLGPELNQNGGSCATPLLTVWRKLWVENDSMEAIPTDSFGYKRNDLSAGVANPIIGTPTLGLEGTATIIPISQISDLSSFLNPQHSRIFIQGVSYDVAAASSREGVDYISISGNHTSLPPGAGFRLYDDDDFVLTENSLQRLDLVNDQMKNYFKPSFIELRDAAAYNPRKTVPLHLNEDVSTNMYGVSDTVVADARDLTDKNSLWVCPVTAAYQGPQSEDNDPGGSGEGYLMGETASHGDYDHSTVFVETCRENYDASLRNRSPGIASLQIPRLKKLIIAVMSHEMGHQPGSQVDDHYEKGLMGEPIDVSFINPENAKFTARSVFRFRKSNRWSQ